MAEKMTSVTIDDVRPPDRVDGYPTHVPRWYTKLFESLPAIITWVSLALPVIFALIGWPEGFVIYMSFLVTYWAIRGLFFMFGIIITYNRMKRDVQVDWVKKIKKEKLDYNRMKYVIIYPVTGETTETIRPAFEGWANSTVDSKKISIVVGIEERFEKHAKEQFKPIVEEYKKKFKEIIFEVHPKGIKGEIVGVKGGNINWATRKFVEKVEKRGEDIKDYLLVTCDSDLIPHEKFLAACTYKHLTSPTPLRETYSTAIHLFSNNIWRVPALVRVFSNFVSVAIMHKWGLFGKDANATFSAYAVNLYTVKDVHYWDPQLENDDTAFYWNARTRYAGKFQSDVVYIPTYNDAVENETNWKTYQSLWKQQVRWGWGTMVLPMAWAAVYKRKDMTKKSWVSMALRTFDDRLLFRTAVYLITFGVPIITFLSPEFQFSSASYALPKLMSVILNIVLLFNIPIIVIRRKLIPPPKEWGIFRNIMDIVEMALLLVILLTYGFMPTTQAQTEMMFRKGATTKDHYATEKVAINSKK
jgi:hypothetical protein